MNQEQLAQLQGALSPNIQFALPQTIQPVVKTQRQVQSVRYDPEKLQALVSALKTPAKTEKGKWELLGNALAKNITSPTYKGAYDVEFTNPYVDALASAVNVFNDIYGGQKQQEREAENAAREDAIKAAQLEAEASKQQVVDQISQDYIKLNQEKAPEADTSYRFTPEKINELKLLNDKAGRWATDWGKGVSDIANTEQSKAYNEFEGKAKQYVQDQLKKIYGAQMTEAEGERFFKSMGLSPKLAPELRWQLVENALDDLARKNNMTIKADNSQAINDFMKGTI